MAPDTFYFLLRHDGKTIPLLTFRLNDSQTIITSPLFKELRLPALHTTVHQPSDSHPTTVMHLRESVDTDIKTLMRNNLNQTSPTLLDLGGLMVDLHIKWDTLKPFRKQSFTDSFTLDIKDFGVYLTVYSVQGRQDEIHGHFKQLLDDNKALMVVPHADGFGTVPGGTKVNYTQCIFEGTRDVTIGVLALGCSEVDTAQIEGGEPWDSSLLGKMKYAVFAPEKRYVGKID
jgi:hypothetical protein